MLVQLAHHVFHLLHARVELRVFSSQRGDVATQGRNIVCYGGTHALQLGSTVVADALALGGGRRRGDGRRRAGLHGGAVGRALPADFAQEIGASTDKALMTEQEGAGRQLVEAILVELTHKRRELVVLEVVG